MLNRFPRSMPPLDDMLHDIGNPTNEALAKALGVSTRTAQRWTTSDSAPRVARLAIFWLTQWGQSIVECDAVNTTRLYVGYVNALRDEVKQLRDRLRKLGEIGDFGASNDPAPGVMGNRQPAAPTLTSRQSPSPTRRRGTARTTFARTRQPAEQPPEKPAVDPRQTGGFHRRRPNVQP